MLITFDFEFDRLLSFLAAMNLIPAYRPDAPPACSPTQTLDLELYVRDFYQGSLNRQPTASELQSRISQLRQSYGQGQSQLAQSIASMGRQLFLSQEYVNRNRSNNNFVYDLFKTYLHREPDVAGWAYWEGQVPSQGRNNVREAFPASVEFMTEIVAKICPSGSGASTIMPTDGLSTLAFDSATNRITTAGYLYDAAGNQTRIVKTDGSVQRFQYDAANRMVKVADDYGNIIQTVTYGDDNERLVVQDGDSTSNYRTYYFSDDVEYVETPDSPTALKWSKTNIYSGERLLSVITPTQPAANQPIFIILTDSAQD